MAKHLLDETAEFKMPTIGRHMADDENDPGDLTQRLTAGARRQPPVPDRSLDEDQSR